METLIYYNSFYILVRDLFYKWWNKFEYSDIIKEINKDVQTYTEYSLYVEQEQRGQRLYNLEKQEFKTPILVYLKKKYPHASVQDLKKKMLMALASQLDEINDDVIMSTSFKSQAHSLK